MLEEQFIAMAEAVRANVRYDMAMNVSQNEFFALLRADECEAERRLVFNLYTNHIHNAPL